jgi:hypothetical protein
LHGAQGEPSIASQWVDCVENWQMIGELDLALEKVIAEIAHYTLQ